MARRIRHSIRAHAHLLGFHCNVMARIKYNVPNDLTGVTLQTATALGMELSPEGLCQYVLTATGPITLYAYLNALASALMAAELNCLHFGGSYGHPRSYEMHEQNAPPCSITVTTTHAKVSQQSPQR